MRALRETAFTLLEVMISMGIFSIAALGVLGMVTTSMTLTANARQSQESDMMANWAMEQMQMIAVTDPNINGCSFAAPCWVSGTGAGMKNMSVVTMGVPEMTGLPNTTPSTRYQMSWFLDNPGGNTKLNHYAITVAWPRDRQEQNKLAPTVNCTATPGSCFRYSYHSYRAIP